MEHDCNLFKLLENDLVGYFRYKHVNFVICNVDVKNKLITADASAHHCTKQ